MAPVMKRVALKALKSKLTERKAALRERAAFLRSELRAVERELRSLSKPMRGASLTVLRARLARASDARTTVGPAPAPARRAPSQVPGPADGIRLAEVRGDARYYDRTVRGKTERFRVDTRRGVITEISRLDPMKGPRAAPKKIAELISRYALRDMGEPTHAQLTAWSQEAAAEARKQKRAASDLTANVRREMDALANIQGSIERGLRARS